MNGWLCCVCELWRVLVLNPSLLLNKECDKQESKSGGRHGDIPRKRCEAVQGGFVSLQQDSAR